MQTKDRIIETLEQLNEFFIQHNVNAWVKKTQQSIISIKEEKIDLNTILKDFTGAGMGSLIDLYISSDNGHFLQKSELETNKDLEKLVEKILTIKDSLND